MCYHSFSLIFWGEIMFSRVASVGLFGLESYLVEVEANLGAGLPRFDIVGLPDTAVSESRERVRAAVHNNEYDCPVSRITINLAPADKKKEGPVYDLPILVAILKSTGQLRANNKVKSGYVFGREVMTCCIADIKFMGLPIILDSKYQPDMWYDVYALIEKQKDNRHSKTMPILKEYEIKMVDIPAQNQQVATFY